MSNFRIKKQLKHNVNMKDSNTLEIKHRQKIKQIENKKISLDKNQHSLAKINDELNRIDIVRERDQLVDLEKRSELLNNKSKIEHDIDIITNNMDEINYYDLIGDLLTEYYDIRNNKSTVEIKNILEYLSPEYKNKKIINTKANLFERFCQRVEGIRVNKDIGTNRIKYCNFIIINTSVL